MPAAADHAEELIDVGSDVGLAVHRRLARLLTALRLAWESSPRALVTSAGLWVVQGALPLVALILLAVAIVMVVLPYVMAGLARRQATEGQATERQTRRVSKAWSCLRLQSNHPVANESDRVPPSSAARTELLVETVTRMRIPRVR